MTFRSYYWQGAEFTDPDLERAVAELVEPTSSVRTREAFEPSSTPARLPRSELLSISTSMPRRRAASDSRTRSCPTPCRASAGSRAAGA